MKLVNLIAVFFLTLLLSNHVFSDSPVSGTQILEIGSYTANRIFVKTGTNGSTVNPAGCSATTFGLDKNAPNFKEMYTALLVAMANYGKVNLRISSTECINGVYPKINYIGIVP